MKRTVLIFSVDLIPTENSNVSGGGLRAWTIGEGLRVQGHEVVYSLPEEMVQEDNFNQELLPYVYKPENLREVIRKVGPDVIVFEQWGLATYLEEVNIPVVIDFHGSLLLENYYRQHGKLQYNISAKIKAFAKADYFICPNNRQKEYLLPWLMISGLPIEGEHIGVIPVSMSPDLPQKNLCDENTFIFSGSLWPWINPFPGLEILAKEIEREENGKLKLFSQKPSLNKILPKDTDRVQPAISLEGIVDDTYVQLLGFIPHDQLIEEFSNATVAFDLYQKNKERRLACSTRTIEFLWSGLPVIHADYSDLAPLIQEYRAGWCLDPNDTAGLRKIISEIYEEKEKLVEYGQNAQQLVKEKFTWDKTIAPLNDYLT